MKKTFIVLCMAILISVSANLAFASDINIGLNVKGTDSDTLGLALEAGYQGDYVGGYGQIGLNEVFALAGITVSGPDFPLGVFIGAGARRVADTLTAYTSSTYRKDYDNWWMDYEITQEASLEAEAWTVAPFMEAGLMVDAGPIYWKVGWTNYEGDAVTISIGASL